MQDIRQRAQDAWEGFVGNQSVSEFMELSIEQGNLTPEAAANAYVEELRRHPEGVSLHVDDIPDDLADLLAYYIRMQDPI